MPSAKTIFQRIEALAAISEDNECLTRRYLTPEHAACNKLVGEWMKDAGMSVHVDAAGNIIGRIEGREPGLPALVFGSHLDTVKNAGKYDGMLGVITPIQCVQELKDRARTFDFAIEVVGFADEEGLRFQSTLLGSRAIAGTFDQSLFERTDGDGNTLSDAMRNFGLDADRIGEAARHPNDIAAYVELHIEQGPVLESLSLPVGVVTSIAGATRLQVNVHGTAGHAGTVPMTLRKDALTAAALMVTEVEQRCMLDTSLVGTVGRFEVAPGAVNVIPGDVLFSIDIRSGVDTKRDDAVDDVIASIEKIAHDRGVSVTIEETHKNSGCECSSRLIENLRVAIVNSDIEPKLLPSGAGHDAMAIADIADVGMLFVRCEAGVSHSPDERMLESDAEIGARVLTKFIEDFSITS